MSGMGRQGMLSNLAKIRMCVRTFRSDDAGAVTVDWVVLSASIIALSVFLVKSFIIPIDVVTDIVSDALEAPADP